jgi:hypothetical protein
MRNPGIYCGNTIKGEVREGLRVDSAQHTQLVNFIWGIADDVLRDVYVKGKYRDVILPMVVIRRLDSVLEPTKQKVWRKEFPFISMGRRSTRRHKPSRPPICS